MGPTRFTMASCGVLSQSANRRKSSPTTREWRERERERERESLWSEWCFTHGRCSSVLNNWLAAALEAYIRMWVTPGRLFSMELDPEIHDESMNSPLYNDLIRTCVCTIYKQVSKVTWQRAAWPPLTHLGKCRPIRHYNTRCCFNVRSKADMSQLNLYRTETTTKKCKSEKNRK